MSSPTVPRPRTSHSLDTRTTAWPHQIDDPFPSTHPPLLALSESTHNTQHQQIDGSALGYQNYPMTTTAPLVSIPLPNDAVQGNDHHLASFTNIQARSTSASGSAFPDYTRQGQSGYQTSDYIPQPSDLGFRHQRDEPADVSATQIARSQGPPGPPWIPNQWGSSQYGSVASQGMNGV